MVYEREMKTMEVHEFKNGLSRYLREVRLGATLLVTDRGTVVAEIREPPRRYANSTTYTVIERWIEEGSVRPPLTTKRPLSITNVTLPDGTGQALLDQDRGV